jgi:uncharacterized protein
MHLRKAVLVFVGTVCVGLAVLGMLLPLMPTTVFLLAAAYCYARSSERFHTWLMNNRLFGSYISNYKAGNGISARQKAFTVITLWLSIGFSIWAISARFWATLLLLVIATAVTVHVLLVKTHRPQTAAEAAPADAA